MKKVHSSIVKTNKNLLANYATKQSNLAHLSSESLVGVLDLDKVLATALEKLVIDLGYEFSGIQLPDSTGQKLFFRKVHLRGPLKRLVEKHGQTTISRIVLDFRNEEDSKNLLAQSFLKNEITISHCMYDFTRPVLSKISARTIGKLIHAKSLVGIPLRYKGSPIGVLGILEVTKKTISKSEKDLLQTLSNQIALAIENAKEHERIIEDYKKSLREKNKPKKSKPNIKFTLRITEEIEQYLGFKARENKQSKAEYVRGILEDLRKQDKDFK